MPIDLDVGGGRARVAGLVAAGIIGGLMFAWQPHAPLLQTLPPAVAGLVLFANWESPRWYPIRQRIGGLTVAVLLAWIVAATGGGDSPFVALFFIVLVYEAMVRFTGWFALDATATAVAMLAPAVYDPAPRLLPRLAILLAGAGGAAAFARILVHDANQQAETLASYERRFRRLAEGVDGVVYWMRLQPDVALEYINPAIERITGFSRDEFLADPDLLKRRVRDDDVRAIDQSLTTEAREAKAGRAIYRFERRDGTHVWIEDHYVPHRDRFGTVTALQGMMFDISARVEGERARDRALEYERRAATHLRETVEMQQSFLQSISHELRTPLTTVIGVAQLLQSERLDPTGPEYRILLERLVAQAGSLHRKLEDMGEVARLGDESGSLELEDIDLSMLVRQEAAQTDVDDHTVHIDVAGGARVRGDFASLRRLLTILLDNSVRHTPPGGSIWVSLHSEGDAVVLRVDDEGPGVPEELREAVFQPFRQGNDVRSRPRPGTGIGLALAQQFVAAHRGSVRCLTRPGGGARFEVRLPVAKSGS